MKSKIVNIIAISIIVIGFFAGLFCGDIFRIPSEYTFEEPSFNYGIAAVIGGSSAILGFFILIFGAILKNLEIIVENLNGKEL